MVGRGDDDRVHVFGIEQPAHVGHVVSFGLAGAFEDLIGALQRCLIRVANVGDIDVGLLRELARQAAAAAADSDHPDIGFIIGRHGPHTAQRDAGHGGSEKVPSLHRCAPFAGISG
jgi:hypothetical protein